MNNKNYYFVCNDANQDMRIIVSILCPVFIGTRHSENLQKSLNWTLFNTLPHHSAVTFQLGTHNLETKLIHFYQFPTFFKGIRFDVNNSNKKCKFIKMTFGSKHVFIEQLQLKHWLSSTCNIINHNRNRSRKSFSKLSIFHENYYIYIILIYNN